MKKILFSPLGMTDPTRGNYDGAFLHIMRHYKPEKAYLFMTKEVCKIDDKDNRYEIMADKLKSYLDFECEIVKDKHYEIDNPQEFEIFYEPFEKIINQLKRENPEAQILINASSGTPQMKNAVNIICAVSKFPITSVQVHSPNAKSNDTEAIINYCADEEWDNLFDNDPDLETKNRCCEVQIKNIRAMISRENIVAHIRAYDYKAAYRASEDINNYLSDGVIRLIKAGSLRINLSISEAEKEANAAGYDLYPVKTSDIREIFEYLQYLNIKNKRKEMADFIRGISPLVSDMFEKYLEKKCKISIRKFCTGNSIKILRREMMDHDMQAAYDNYFNETNKGCFRDGFLCAGNILPMILHFSNEPYLIEIVKKLRDIEESTRNKVAHEIIEVTDGWLKKESGFTSSEIYGLLEEMFKITFGSEIKGKPWDTYDKLNEEIISRIYK